MSEQDSNLQQQQQRQNSQTMAQNNSQQQQQRVFDNNTRSMKQDQYSSPPPSTDNKNSESSDGSFNVNDWDDLNELNTIFSTMHDHMSKTKPLQYQKREFRDHFDKVEQALNQLKSRCDESIFAGVGLAGFNRDDAESIKDTINSSNITPGEKRTFGAYVASNAKLLQLSRLENEKLAQQKRKLEEDYEALKSSQFGTGVSNKKTKNDSSFSYTEKSGGGGGGGGGGSSRLNHIIETPLPLTKKSQRNNYDMDEEERHEPQFFDPARYHENGKEVTNIQNFAANRRLKGLMCNQGVQTALPIEFRETFLGILQDTNTRLREMH
jgi:hypothetical protein